MLVIWYRQGQGMLLSLAAVVVLFWMYLSLTLRHTCGPRRADYVALEFDMKFSKISKWKWVNLCHDFLWTTLLECWTGVHIVGVVEQDIFRILLNFFVLLIIKFSFIPSSPFNLHFFDFLRDIAIKNNVVRFIKQKSSHHKRRCSYCAMRNNAHGTMVMLETYNQITERI